MNIQEELKNKVVSYVLKNDLVDTDEVVNAFTLYTVIGEKLSQLEEEISLESLRDKINTILFKNKLSQKSAVCETILGNYHKTENENTSDCLELLFCFSDGVYQHIYKEVDGKRLYYLSPDEKLSHYIFPLFIEEIDKSCNRLEEFATLFYNNQKSFTYRDFPSVEIQTQGKDFDTDFFYAGNGQIEKRIFFHLGEKIIDVSKQVSETEKEEILKKIPVEVKNLSPVCQRIYKNYQASYQKKRV